MQRATGLVDMPVSPIFHIASRWIHFALADIVAGAIERFHRSAQPIPGRPVHVNRRMLVRTSSVLCNRTPDFLNRAVDLTHGQLLISGSWTPVPTFTLLQNRARKAQIL